MPSLLDALQLALGGVGAGMTSYSKGLAQREEEERLRREEQRRIEAEKKAQERQQRLDDAAIRAEQRELRKEGFVTADQYTGVNPRDMPGATPRAPVERQIVGGREYVLPESAETRKHREGAMKMMGERKELDEAIKAGTKLGVDENKLRLLGKLPPSIQGVMAARLFPAPERSRDADLSDEEKEMIGRQFISAQAKNQALTRALSTAFAQNPALAETPGVVAYNLMKRGVVPKMSPLTEYKPPKPAKGNDDELAELIRAGEQWKAGQRGGTAAPAPPATVPAGPAAPAGADPERYRTDANYRQWVDSQIRR